MNNKARYTKAFIAVGGFIASGVSASADGHISINDVFVMLAGALAAAGVYYFPNSGQNTEQGAGQDVAQV